MAGEWVQGKAAEIYREFFPGDWEDMGNGVLQGRCPAEDRHSKGRAKTDCRVYLGYGAGGQTPGIYCQHTSCKGVLDEMNDRFRARLFERDGERVERSGLEGVRNAPRAREAWIPEYDEAALREYVQGVTEVDKVWFMERSPVDVREVKGPGDYLEQVYEPGEMVLVLMKYKGQGEFLWWCGKGGYRLSDKRGVKAVPSALPTNGGQEGAWYICNPVDGKWYPNPRREGRWSRRSQESIAKWQYLVLESDEAPAGLWLRLLARCGLPIVAIYSSGKRSWHALWKCPCDTKGQADAYLRDKAKRLLPKLGADPGALTSLRATRLPGVTREGRMQELIYLNPNPRMDAMEEIRFMERRRVMPVRGR